MIYKYVRSVLFAFALGLLLPAAALAQQAPTLGIGTVSPGTSIQNGNELTINLQPSGFTGTVSYTLSDSFNGSSANASEINAGSGVFVWIPSNSDGGTHNLTFTATDGTNSASATEQIIVVGPAGLSIQSISPGTTLLTGQTLTFSIAANNISSPTYTASDSFPGSTMPSGAINSSGSFSWTPQTTDVGTHTITIIARDQNNNTTSTSQTFTVSGSSATLALSSLTPGTTVAPGQPLTFTVTPTGFSSPSYTLSDNFSNSSLSNSAINSSGNFSWTPVLNDTGTHTITVTATDGNGHTATVSTQVVVGTGGASITLTAPNPSAAPGTTLVFTVYPNGFTSPTYSLSDSFSGSSISNSDINSSGGFAWTPVANDIGTHNITVTVSDSYGHTSTANVQITVTGTAQTITTTSTSTTLPAFTFSNYLSPGITSDDVTELQTVLTQQGFFSGTPTGYYGPVTEAAVIAFQAAHGIDQLGVVGPATRAALNALTSGTTATTSTSTTATTGDGYMFSNFLDVGSTGTDVTELQQRLTTLDLYSGPITGYFGDLTQAAVMAFQGQHNIEQVGYVGPATRAALNGQ